MKTVTTSARLALLAVALLGTSASLAETYKWTDEQGKVHYGDNPPAAARDPKPLQAGVPRNQDALLGAGFEVRQAATRYPVVLYTGTGCAPCDSGRALLRARGIPFTERTINTSADLKAFQPLGYGDKLPVLTVGSQTLGAFAPDAWGQLLDAAGYPRTNQLPRNWQAPAPVPMTTPPAPESPGAEGTATQPADPDAPPRRVVPAVGESSATGRGKP